MTCDQCKTEDQPYLTARFKGKGFEYLCEECFGSLNDSKPPESDLKEK